MRIATSAGWLLVVLASTAVAAGEQAERIARVERTLRPAVTFEGEPGWTIGERMRHYEVPGVGIAVIQDFEVAWFKTYGLADRATGAPVKEDTLFQAGSVSKPVTAFGVMTLARDGKLKLDADVNEFLKTWKLPEGEQTAEQRVTLTRLLSHTAGVTVHGFPGYAAGAPVPGLVQVLDGVEPANTPPIRVDTVPGTLWRYSGGGYTIAQQTMIDTAGRPFPELMQERVLGPLGMKRSTFENPLPPKRLAHAAAGYLPDHTPVAGKRHTYPEMAAAGLWTTAGDLATFALEVQRALHGQSKVLSRGLAEKLVEPVDPSFGRGFALARRDEAPYFSHNGWDEGFCAALLAHKTAGYGVAVMINSNHPALMDEIIRAVAQEYGWAGYKIFRKRELPADAAPRYAGRYRYNAEQAFTISANAGRLFMQYTGSDPEELLYVGDGRYMRRERTAPITFTEDGGEVVFEFILDDGTRQRHPRLPADARQPREVLLSAPYAEGLAAYRAVLQATPDEPSVSEGYLNNQGLALVSDKRFEPGILLLRVATDLYPDSANTWDSLGYAYREAGDRAKAIENYRLALERDPKFPSAVQALKELESE